MAGSTGNPKIFPRWVLWIGLAAFAVLTLTPFLWLILSSVQPSAALLRSPAPLWPESLTLANYRKLFDATAGAYGVDFVRAMVNSTVAACAATALSLFIGVPGAYAFARLWFPGRGVVLLGVLVLLMLPGIAIVIPLYLSVRELGLYDRLLGLILAYTTFALPFVLWVMQAYFRTVPMELEEAARIDGCSRFGAFLRIALPLVGPGLAAAAIFVFLMAWDEFLFALTLTSTYRAKTLPVALAEFQGRHFTDWGLMTAGGVLASLPPVAVALLMQRYLMTGLASGGVKA